MHHRQSAAATVTSSVFLEVRQYMQQKELPTIPEALHLLDLEVEEDMMKLQQRVQAWLIVHV